VHGNVLEWVEDCWNESYSGAPTDGSAWTSGDCSGRVLRGGSWYYLPAFLRSPSRFRGRPDDRFLYIGFRVARMLAP
jgi:formylglycine-generating enzyme required for sulfatase activity